MADRNEEKRTEIWRKIVKIEDKEDRLRATKKQYEQQLTNFYSDIQSIHYRMINLLSLSPSSRQLIEQIESDNRTIQRQVNSYVEEELDTLEKQTKKACRSFDEAREELIA
ncbi:hypothetical protein, partial [Streptococcus sp. HMSC070B10]|uniref:hypothetical protein n=1 Tax=Streptococcus sp. HMSC070B10 TaxID=1715092 RepID=UPI0008A11294